MSEVERFFEQILDVEGSKLLWLLSSQDGRKRSFWFDDHAELAKSIEPAADSEYHVYFGMGSRRRAMEPHERGERGDYFQYKALWLDIDVLGPNHKSDRLPPSIESGQELLARLPLEPTYVVNSGGGLQAYWVLTEAVDASELEAFLPSWHATWRHWGDERGWHVDNVFDLGRVMRAPGSLNKKNNAPVEIISSSTKTYDLSDFDPYLREADSLVVSAPRVEGSPERPGDAYNRMHSDPAKAVAHAVHHLQEAGWQPLRARSNGERPYVRPGKDTREGISAMVYPDGHMTVYSSDPGLTTTDAEKVGKPLDPFGVYVMFACEGDFERATSRLRAEGFGDPLPDDSWVLEDRAAAVAVSADTSQELELPDAPVEESRWKFRSLFDLADAPEEPPPSVGFREDDICLFYRGKVHTVFGEPGGMKSWFMQVIGKQMVELDEDCLWVDAENSEKSVYDRFCYIGVSGDDLKRIYITKPDHPFGPAERRAFEELAAEKKFALIVVDGTTDVFSVFGLDVNSSTDAAKFDQGFLKVLASTGAAVVYIDHVTKDKETRGSWGFGTQHKKSAIDGASYGVESISSFGKGMHGRARVVIHKDKPGDLLQHALEGVHSTICELDMISDPETHRVTAKINEPSPDTDSTFRPSHMMEEIAKFVEANPGLGTEVVRLGAGLTTGNDKFIRRAFQLLAAEGYIRDDIGDPRDRRWRSVKPFDPIQDHLDHYGTGPVQGENPKLDESMDRLRKRMERVSGGTGSGEDDRPPVAVVTASVPVSAPTPHNEDLWAPRASGVALEDLL
jgi:hypothetical protein